MGKLIGQFSKEVQVVNKYVKKFSASLAIKEMQIKTTEISCHSSQNSNHQENK
jgi:DNA-binding protein